MRSKFFIKYITATLLALFFIACSTGSSIIEDTGDIKGDSSRKSKTLYRNYTGSFIWEGDSEYQQLSIEILKQEISNGVITATGKGKYKSSYQITNIDVKIYVNTATGFFEMWELNPDQGQFVTEGSHLGSITGDFSKVEATWVTTGSGLRGKLILNASR